MPYITPEQRERIANEMRLPNIATEGSLNYVLTKVIKRYLDGRPHVRYVDYNAVVGALECCKLELYRRLIAEHEDRAMAVNGDVYGGR